MNETEGKEEVADCWREEGETGDKEGVHVLEERRDSGEREGEVPPGRSSWGGERA